MRRKISIIGAGPAGLGCAYELIKTPSDISLVIFDKNDKAGGLARTEKFKNHYFDIGPHRFYTKNKEVEELWKQVLKEDLVKIKRHTVISYNNKFFLYPIQVFDVLTKLNFYTNLQIVFSFILSQILLKHRVSKTFEEAIIKKFGEKLYLLFFKTYTEKIWGIPCNRISAKWADQRIGSLNFIEILKNALLNQKTTKAKSLVNEFFYTTKGAGLMYQKLSSIISKKGGRIKLRSKITRINYEENKIVSIETEYDNKRKLFPTDYLFSSMPLTNFIFSLNPKPDKKILDAAGKLLYRDHITVNLLFVGGDIFPYNWVYIHSPDVKMARVTNYNSFYKNKPHLETAISVEYFSFQKDKLWKMLDKELIILALNELRKLGMISSSNGLIGGFVIREAQSYPVYYVGHEKYFEVIKKYVSRFTNLSLIGRGGMYKYNNMDHATYSGMLAARNYFARHEKYDIWQLNEDAEYLEESNEKY